MKLLMNILLLFISPTFAHTEIQTFDSNPVILEWQDHGESYEYLLKIYLLENDQTKLQYSSEWIDSKSIELELTEGSYLWEVYIKEEDKTCEDDHQCFNIESGYFDLSLPKIENSLDDKEDMGEQESTWEESIHHTKEEPVEEKEVLGTMEKNKYIAKEKFIKKDSKDSESNQVEKEKAQELDSNTCKYSYNVKKKEFKLKECNIKPPTINSSTYSIYNDQYIVNSKGNYQNTLKVIIENTVCKNFNLLDPKTWLRCEEVVMDNTEYSIDLNHEVYFLKDNIISPMNFFFEDKRFEISSVLDQLPTDLVFKGYFSLNHRSSWLDQELVIKIPITSQKAKNINSEKYNFPFSKIVHVNQWHGCTEYQCPHTGIDFAAVKESIYASEHGVVVAQGYDTYYGECNSGGNYLLVKYDNGEYMSYMHLEKIYVKNNQEIKKGDLLALSGNSGAYNCQPLGYHLHFELRKERSQSTHIDPVPHIDINWNLIKTNMSDRYPQRLTGDNPHPNF